LLLLPLGLLLLKIIYDACNKKPETTNDLDTFNFWKSRVTESLTCLNNHIANEDTYSEDMAFFQDSFKKLNKNSNSSASDMKTLSEDLDYFLEYVLQNLESGQSCMRKDSCDFVQN
jgi:hypothetical protein